MNRLGEFRRRYVKLVGDEDINFSRILIYNRYDFLNHHLFYKNIKYYNVQVIIKYILNLNNSQFEFIKSICSWHHEIYGEEKRLYKDIVDYLKNVSVQEMLNEFIVLDRKRKIEEFLKDE